MVECTFPFAIIVWCYDCMALEFLNKHNTVKIQSKAHSFAVHYCPGMEYAFIKWQFNMCLFAIAFLGKSVQDSNGILFLGLPGN